MAVPGRAALVLLVSFIASFSASDITMPSAADVPNRRRMSSSSKSSPTRTLPRSTVRRRCSCCRWDPVHEHGPHLPLGADTFGLMHEANGAAARVGRTLPDWNVVLMPSLNYGNSGANHIGRHVRTSGDV